MVFLHKQADLYTYPLPRSIFSNTRGLASYYDVDEKWERQWAGSKNHPWRKQMAGWNLIFLTLCYIGSHLALAQTDEPALQMKIAYNVFFDEQADDYEIFVMNADGSGQKNITNNKAVDWVYYAYKDKIYFVSDRDAEKRKYHLFEMDANGKNIRRVSQFLLNDSWLSSRTNGSEFVVTSSKDGQGHELYLIDRNGAELKRLTQNSEYENDPSFSPDGQKVVFRSRKSGIDELWVMNADGSDWRQLTHFPMAKDTGKRHGYHAGPPIWEPNSNRISFCSKQDGGYRIYSVDPEGKNLQAITPEGFEGIWHNWSPDGRWLLADGKTEDGKYDIFLMLADGSDLRRLTKGPKYEQAPVFVQATTP